MISMLAMEMTLRSVIGKHPELAALAFGGMTFGTVSIAYALRVYQRRARRLSRSLLILVLSALLIAVCAAAVAARLMVLTAGELSAVVEVTVVSAGFAVLLVLIVSRSIGGDVRDLERSVRRIESGDRTLRVGSRRGDELGHVGSAINDLVDRLNALEFERAALELERQNLLTNIGHDLRSPLAALQAATEALVDGVARDPQRYLRSMLRDIEALGALIEDVALLSQLDANRLDLERIPIDLVEIADAAIESLEPVATVAGVRLVMVHPGPVHVIASPVALTRIIRNLIDNGIRHAPSGTDVTVHIASEGAATVRVSDAGPGFPSDFRESAFDRFTCADASRSRNTGTAGGLGLAIARGLVEAHGGEIWIEDSSPTSVAFRVPLPV
ncbi:MAG: HAMP domain-containing sensor histidine kinase [Ilumatobacteraceae bacterium]